MPAFVKLFCVAIHDSSGPGHVKQMPGTIEKMFRCGCVGVLANSGLMFQMNVGWFALASWSAPVNCSVARNVANELSSDRLAVTFCEFCRPVMSSYCFTM